MYTLLVDNITVTLESIPERPDIFDDEINSSCWKWLKNLFKMKK